MLSKESAVIFFPLAVWWDVCFASLQNRRQWMIYGAYTLPGIIWLLLRSLAIGDMPANISALDNPLVEASLSQRLLTAVCIQFDYLKLLVLPVGLSSDYSYNQIPLVSSLVDLRLWGFVAVLSASFSLAWIKRKDYPAASLAVGGYAILIAPTSNVLVLIPTIMGERLSYVPSIFFCLLLGWGVWELRRLSIRIAGVVGSLLLVVYAGLTIARNETWATADSFYRTQYRSAPHSARAHLGMGKMHTNAGRLDSAMVYYRGAIALFPQYAMAWYNLGLVHTLKKEWDTADKAYQRAVELEPGYVKAWYNLGGVQQQQGDLNAAIQSYGKVLSLKPDHADGWNALGVIYYKKKNYDLAHRAFAEALSLSPQHSEALRNFELLQKIKN